MMRNCIVFALIGMAAMAAAVTPNYYFTKTADMDFLLKQKKIFDLLMFVDAGVHNDAEYFEVGRNYDISINVDNYQNKEVVVDFLMRYKLGFLRKDALFTYYNQEHREEMMLLYRLFYFAKDFPTFYKTACWARLYMNHGMYTTALTTAVIYREDTKYIRLPAIYEIYPNLFFDSKVIREAQHIKMTHGQRGYEVVKQSDNTENTFFIYNSLSDICVSPAFENEYRMSYFMNDVTLNAYYYYFRMMYPFWMDLKDYNLPKNFRGDFYFFFHKQIMSRYYLERISHGMGVLEDFTWDRMELPGFYSDIQYINGVSMPRRDWWNVVPFYKYQYLEYLKKLETRILEAIDSGFFYDEQGKQYSLYTTEGLNYLGNIIEGNCDSLNIKYFGAYDVLARDTLGMNFDCKCKDYYVPSSLQIFSTSMRDPAFYRIYDRILYFFHRYKSLLHRYTMNELNFPGIKIENVDMDKLYTYFDHKDYYINNAVAVDSYKEGKSFTLKAWQYHLNYKPFNYKFNINSDKDTKAVMRIFLGPAIEGEKYDDYSYLLHYYKYFFMLDEFELDLKSGMNNYERFSADSWLFKHGFETGDGYYKKVLKAIEGHEPFTYTDRMWAFPSHLMLPRGTVDGMRFKMFFYIGPYEEAKTFEMPIFGFFKFYGKSFGFPLDRPMQPWFFQLNNLFFKDVYIYHMKDTETKYDYNHIMKSYAKDYDQSIKNFDYKNFDYKNFDYKNFDYKNFDYKNFDYKNLERKNFDMKHYTKDYDVKPFNQEYVMKPYAKDYDMKQYGSDFDTKYFKDFAMHRF